MVGVHIRRGLLAVVGIRHGLFLVLFQHPKDCFVKGVAAHVNTGQEEVECVRGKEGERECVMCAHGDGVCVIDIDVRTVCSVK